MSVFDPLRAVAAAAVLLAYAAMCGALFLRRRAVRRRAAKAADELLRAAPGAAPLLIAYASQTGHAEALAWQSARQLQSVGVAATPRPLGELTLAELQGCGRVLFIASTYGEGDAPDTAAAFARRVMATDCSLPGLHYGLLALGDSGYRHFCGFGRRLDAWLQARGAQGLFERIDMDNADPQAWHRWQRSLAQVAGTSDLPPELSETQAAGFESWRLTARRLLNPGSQGEPCFHIELQPPSPGDWHAGDLIELQPPGDPKRPRAYSIASLPQDGAVHLLVRQQRRAEGSIGVASGWLTEGASVGERVAMRLRPNRNFRIGDNAHRPLLLIGNGTGLAGLRAHLKARAWMPETSREPCWLVFGERQAAHDDLYRDEIAAWLASGVLARADLVYSRDGPTRRHVQHRLDECANELRDWVARGCAIYVCGSLHGMAAGVDASLRAALGEAEVEHLVEEGRLRRDVY